MATITYKTIKTSGGDYATLQAFAAGEAADITAATGSDEIIWAQADAFSDTTQVTSFTVAAGWKTSATNYIVIEAVDDHLGVRDTTTPSTYYLNVTAAGAPSLAVETGLHLYVIGGQYSNWGGGNSDIFQVTGAGATGLLQLDRVLGIGAGRSFMYQVAGNTQAVNVLRCFSRVGNVVFTSPGGLTCYSGVFTTANGNGHAAVNSLFKNVYMHAPNGTCWPGGTGATDTTCASADASATTVGLRNIAWSDANFVDATGYADAHVLSGNAMINNGTDTSGDAAPFNFTTGIDGYVFGSDGSWDVGFAEYGAAGGKCLFVIGF
jgi:hypothetical protein